jgi:molybdenum cofactor biosynthesis enzyme MoaA
MMQHYSTALGDTVEDIAEDFVPEWRGLQSAAFDIWRNSTAKETIRLDLWGRKVDLYANANLSIYSAQPCNARCAFCVEELRPASRGGSLKLQKSMERSDTRYFDALDKVLTALRPLQPSVSITGGEPSLDPRLPRLLQSLERHRMRKRTITTNGSGLLERRDGKVLMDWITANHVSHLNISRAHWDDQVNAKLMRYRGSPDAAMLRDIVWRANSGNTRVRLSCVLVRRGVDDLFSVLKYLDFAASIGIDNVIFRQLMQTDAATVSRNFVTEFSDRRRVDMRDILQLVSTNNSFEFVRQVMGYYYYVEVWRYRGMDVVFEGADLTQIGQEKMRNGGILHELVFHPNAQLASTWQPWDGVLGPAVDQSYKCTGEVPVP